MPEFDFRPQFDRRAGIGVGDRAAAQMSPLAAIAGASPAILEALHRRQQMIQRNAAIEAISQGLGSDKDMTPDQISQGMKAGLFDAKGLMDVMSTRDLRKQQAEKARQEAEFKKYLMDNGAQPVRNPDGTIEWVVRPPGTGGGPTRPIATPSAPSVNPVDAQIAAMIEEARLKKARLPGTSPDAAPIGGQPSTPQAPAGFETVRNKTTGAYGFRNLKTGKVIAAPK